MIGGNPRLLQPIQAVPTPPLILNEGPGMLIPGGTPPAAYGPNDFSLLGGLTGAIGGFLTGGPAGAVVGGIAGAMGGGGGPSVPTFAPQGGGSTGILQSNPLPGIQIGKTTINPGSILPGGQPFIQPTRTVMAAPGVCAMRGYHPVKQHGKYGAAGSYCVRNRQMNPLNPRALKRALKRAEKFEHFARRVVNARYFSTHKSCGCKTRAPLFKRRSRKRA